MLFLDVLGLVNFVLMYRAVGSLRPPGQQSISPHNSEWLNSGVGAPFAKF
jgi:hypothetical protein